MQGGGKKARKRDEMKNEIVWLRWLLVGKEGGKKISWLSWLYYEREERLAELVGKRKVEEVVGEKKNRCGWQKLVDGSVKRKAG